MSDNNDRVQELLQQLLALELFDHGIAQGEIGKKLGKSKEWVNTFLRGVRRRNFHEDPS